MSQFWITKVFPNWIVLLYIFLVLVRKTNSPEIHLVWSIDNTAFLRRSIVKPPSRQTYLTPGSFLFRLWYCKKDTCVWGVSSHLHLLSLTCLLTTASQYQLWMLLKPPISCNCGSTNIVLYLYRQCSNRDIPQLSANRFMSVNSKLQSGSAIKLYYPSWPWTRYFSYLSTIYT